MRNLEKILLTSCWPLPFIYTCRAKEKWLNIKRWKHSLEVSHQQSCAHNKRWKHLIWLNISDKTLIKIIPSYMPRLRQTMISNIDQPQLRKPNGQERDRRKAYIYDSGSCRSEGSGFWLLAAGCCAVRGAAARQGRWGESAASVSVLFRQCYVLFSILFIYLLLLLLLFYNVGCRGGK